MYSDFILHSKRIKLYLKGVIIGVLAQALWVAPCLASILQVAVSILPQRYFLEKIGGDKVKIVVMIPPGANPALYDPAPKQMAALSRCTLYFSIGVPFEKAWIKRFQKGAPHLKIVSTDRWISKIPMKSKHHAHKSPNGHTTHLDPHVWLSPPLVALQSRVILDALCSAQPDSCGYFEKNYRNWANELVDLDIKLRGIFPPTLKARRFLIYHPAWGYFAATYGLEQVPMELEGKPPSPKLLGRFIEHAKKGGFKGLIVQPQFSDRAAKIVAEQIGANILVVDPLAYNWKENLLKSARIIRSALRP
ncbi:MAG TPA: cation ABC transporter substrate-binding protein [Desulfobacterales bacterium]|nr:cation ABC transporter substrate-binding protein [Desulfobacterales bacterium]